MADSYYPQLYSLSEQDTHGEHFVLPFSVSNTQFTGIQRSASTRFNRTISDIWDTAKWDLFLAIVSDSSFLGQPRIYFLSYFVLIPMSNILLNPTQFDSCSVWIIPVILWLLQSQEEMDKNSS